MPGQITIIYWRDIPAQVSARAGRTNAKRELPKRFIEAVDMAAMRDGAKDSDAYLAEWRRGDPAPCGDDLEAAVDAAISKIDLTYDAARLKTLIANGGWNHAK